MSEAWIAVAVVGAATVLLKSAGPVFLGRRQLPPRVQPVVELLAPVMLAALVTTQTVGRGDALVVDARVAGVAVAALVVALWRRTPIVVAMVVAALVTSAVDWV
jgi:branched-subunit amino acid transport protein